MKQIKQRIVLLCIWMVLFASIPGCSRITGDRETVPGLFQMTDQKQNLADPQSETQESYTINGHFTRPISDEQIFMKLHSGTLLVKENGQTLYDATILSGTQQDFTFSSDWISFQAGQITPEDQIEITVTGEKAASTTEQEVKTLYVGDGLGLLRKMLWKNLPQIIIGIMIGTLGITYAVVLFTFRGVRKEIPGSYMSCSALLICGAVCTLVDYDYITLLVRNVPVINQIDYLS